MDKDMMKQSLFNVNKQINRMVTAAARDENRVLMHCTPLYYVIELKKFLEHEINMADKKPNPSKKKED